jgi:hypothetical protein
MGQFRQFPLLFSAGESPPFDLRAGVVELVAVGVWLVGSGQFRGSCIVGWS